MTPPADLAGRQPSARLRTYRGPLLALLVSCGALALHRGPIDLLYQSLDSWIYVAMADHPSVFTARPWGYRVLTAWIVHALGGQWRFVPVTYAALAATGVVLFLFLRRLGGREWTSLAAVAAFGLSSPVGELLVDPFLCEPITVLVEVCLLLAVASGAGLGMLALLATLGVLSKEILLALIPLVYFSRGGREGRARALGSAVVVSLPAVLATVLMRWYWTPYLRSSRSFPDLATFELALVRLARDGAHTGVFLVALAIVALLGATTAQGRAYLRTYGVVAGLLCVLPFVAWAFIPWPGRAPFFGQNVRRLLVYALPLLLPLCVAALERVLRRPPARPAAARGIARRRADLGAGLAALGLATLPLWGMERYRRVEFDSPPEGAVLLAVCRESLAVARRVEGGERVVIDPERYRFSPAYRRISTIRWFLRDGWGPVPYYDTGDLVMKSRRAALLLPCTRPQELAITLTLTAARDVAVDVTVNGSPLTAVLAGPQEREQRILVPKAPLFRGDNELGLAVSADGDLPVRLHRLVLERAAGR